MSRLLFGKGEGRHGGGMAWCEGRRIWVGKALTFVLGFWFLFCELEMGGRSSKGGVSLCDAGSELNAQSVVKYDANIFVLPSEENVQPVCLKIICFTGSKSCEVCQTALIKLRWTGHPLLNGRR